MLYKGYPKHYGNVESCRNWLKWIFQLVFIHFRIGDAYNWSIITNECLIKTANCCDFSNHLYKQKKLCHIESNSLAWSFTTLSSKPPFERSKLFVKLSSSALDRKRRNAYVLQRLPKALRKCWILLQICQINFIMSVYILKNCRCL